MTHLGWFESIPNHSQTKGSRPTRSISTLLRYSQPLALPEVFLLPLHLKVLILATQQPSSPQTPFIISGTSHEMLNHSALHLRAPGVQMIGALPHVTPHTHTQQTQHTFCCHLSVLSACMVLERKQSCGHHRAKESKQILAGDS